MVFSGNNEGCKWMLVTNKDTFFKRRYYNHPTGIGKQIDLLQFHLLKYPDYSSRIACFKKSLVFLNESFKDKEHQ
jgi:hypothetical protein